VLVALLVTGVLAYPVGGNFMLWSGALAQIINKKPHKLKIEWSSAWTLWPGEIHVEGFSVDIHGKKSRTLVAIDRGTVRMDLLSLTEKTVDILSADVDGVEVSQTKRRSEATQTGEQDDAAATSDDAGQISGDAPEDPGTIEKKKKKPWIIDLKGVAAKNVRLVQLNTLKLVGDGLLKQLDMRLVTKGGPLRIDTLKLDMQADATPDDNTLEKFARIDVDIRMAENIPKQNKGKKLLGLISGRVEVDGDASSIAFVSTLLGKKFNLSVAGGGRLDMVLVLESGELMHGSRIDFISERFATDFLNLHAEGRGEIVGKIDKDLATPASFKIAVDDFRLNRQGVPNPYMEGAGLALELQAARFFLDRDMEEARLLVHFSDSIVRDLTDYNRFIPKQANVHIIEGNGRLRGTMSILGDSGHVNIELDATDVIMDVSGARIGTDFRLVANLAEGSYGGKSYDLSGTYFRMENTQMAKGRDLTKDGWWGEIRFDKGDFFWSEPVDIDAEMTIKMRDTEPLISLLRDTKKRRSFLDNALTVKDLDGVIGIQTNEKDIVLDPIQFEGQGLQVISRLEALENAINGVLYVKLHGIAVNFEIEEGKGKFKGLGGKKKVKKQVQYKSDRSRRTEAMLRRVPHVTTSKNTM
jgi:hypothetical protein